MKTLWVAVASLVLGLCIGVAIIRPSLRQAQTTLAAKEAELATKESEEELALKELKVCTATLKTQNDSLRQNNQAIGEWIKRSGKK
jgi:hypothetical protein